MNKSQFSEWKSHPVTEALNNAVDDRINELKERLVNSFDPEEDRFLKGMIRAFREILQIEPEDLGEDETDA